MAARFGGRATFLAAIALFTFASVGCAASTSLPELVGMRVLQAVGGAMMVPVGRLLVLSRAEPANLMRLTALLVWPGLIAPVVAPLAGGLITTYASWHWLFLINLPLGLLALWVAVRLVHPPALPEPGPLDVVGLLLTSMGLGGLTFTADLLAKRAHELGAHGRHRRAGGCCLIAAVRHLMRVRGAAGRPAAHAHPQLPLGADRLGVSLHRAECRAVSGAAAVRAGLPLECRQGRLDRALHLRRQHRRQARDHLPVLAPRLPQGARRRNCRACGSHSSCSGWSAPRRPSWCSR